MGNEGTAGLLVAPGSADEIVIAINHLRGLPDRGKAMGEQARVRIETRYTWQHSAQRLLQVLAS